MLHPASNKRMLFSSVSLRVCSRTKMTQRAQVYLKVARHSRCSFEMGQQSVKTWAAALYEQQTSSYYLADNITWIWQPSNKRWLLIVSKDNLLSLNESGFRVFAFVLMWDVRDHASGPEHCEIQEKMKWSKEDRVIIEKLYRSSYNYLAVFKLWFGAKFSTGIWMVQHT